MDVIKSTVKKTILDKLRGRGYRFTRIPGSSINYQGVDKDGCCIGFSIHSANPNKFGAYMFDITQEQYDYLESADQAGFYVILDEGHYLYIKWKSLRGFLTEDKSTTSGGVKKWMLDYCFNNIHLKKKQIRPCYKLKNIFEGTEQPSAA